MVSDRICIFRRAVEGTEFDALVIIQRVVLPGEIKVKTHRDSSNHQHNMRGIFRLVMKEAAIKGGLHACSGIT